MCGLGGIACVGGVVSEADLWCVGASLTHRGPDQGGVYSEHLNGLGVGLATRRLAILDLSEAGSQPMHTADGSATIAYNGELYNDPEIRAELERRGCSFRSHSDTETVLYSYRYDGTASFGRLNGMFALAIHDRRENRLILARDRMGIKPLYYAWDGRRLLFASELRTMVRELGVAPVVDPDALDVYLACGYVPAPFCLIQGVKKLAPGSALTLEANGRLSVETYWEPTLPPPVRLSQAAAADAVRRTMTDAIRRQMRSDVPVGVLLSGGVDSTIVAAVAARQTDIPIDTFSIAFSSARGRIDDRFNLDASFAQRAARDLGTTHHEVVCGDGDEVTALLEELAVGLDEPVWETSFISIYLMSRLAREHGVKVLLTGDGGDELFAGYPWIAAAWRQDWYERIPFLSYALDAVDRYAPATSTLRAHAANLRSTAGLPDAERYQVTHTFFSAQERAALTGHAPAVTPVARMLRHLLAGVDGRSRPDRLALIDLALWVRDHFNQRVDRMTSLNSVEARVPFQDNAVVDLALRLPFWTKAPFGRSKSLLKRAFRGIVPDYVLDRPKRPFAAPISDWAGGGLRSFARERLSPDRLAATGLLDPAVAGTWLRATDTVREGRDTYRLWTLLMLQLWAEGLRATGKRSAEDAAACERAEPRYA
ncbi:MAG: asparagine synthase (glutamine-hydrolyzing) [Chloroflexota bacterium]